MNDSDVIIKLDQVNILKKLFHSDFEPHKFKELNGIIKDILGFKQNEIENVLGTLGLKIFDFSNVLDIEKPHPDIFNIYEGQLIGDLDGTFSRQATDLLKISSFAKDNNVSLEIRENLKLLILNHDFYATLSKYIDSPFSNLLHVRFVSDDHNRKLIRSEKNVQRIILESDYRNLCPEDFKSYVRHEDLYDKDLQEAIKKKEHLCKFNLIEMSKEVEKYIEEIKIKIEKEQYFGFNKISLIDAATILANMFELPYDIQHNRFAASHKYKIDLDVDSTEFLEYIPSIYPFEKLRESSSSDVIEVVNHLDNFPEIGGKPLFDHYRVLLPSFDYKLPSPLSTDILLIKNKKFIGILLGERDGEHYFISYWEPK